MNGIGRQPKHILCKYVRSEKACIAAHRRYLSGRKTVSCQAEDKISAGGYKQTENNC